MMLGVKDVAQLLSVSEKTVYRWISKKEIPVYRIGDTYRFNRIELMEWTTAKKIRISHTIFDGEDITSTVVPSLSEGIASGGIYYHVMGTVKEDVLQSIVKLMNLPDEVDRDYLLEALIARENLGSTAVGNGIAIPHIRNPIVFNIDKPIISLCFLEEGMDFKALDGKPVDTFFTIIAGSVKSHLALLSKLNYALYSLEFRDAINPASNRQKILDTVSNFEASLESAGDGSAEEDA